MIPYYLFFMFFGLGAFLDYVKQDLTVQLLKKVVLLVGLGIILFFVGFRYKIGSDWKVYLQTYEDALPLQQILFGENVDFPMDYEPGYELLISFFSSIGVNFPVFVFLITAFNTVVLFYFLLKNNFRNKLVFLAIILILTVFIEFDILRQSLAFHIVLFAFIGERIKLLKLSLLTVLAMTFHYTAIIYLLFFLFQKLNVTRKGVIITIIIYFISLFVTLPIITSCLKLIEPFVGGILHAIVVKAENLIEGFSFSRNISFTSLLNLSFLILLAVNIRKLKLSFMESTLIKMFLFYILLNALLKEVQEVADRFSYYFNFGIAFMFALLVDLVRIRERKMLIMIVPGLFILMRLFLHFRQDAVWYGQTPYRNYFFVEEADEDIILKRYDIMLMLKGQENEGKKK